MKRYLYIIVSVVAMMLVTACDILSEIEVCVFHFGESEVTTTSNSATVVADIPYITINGVRQAAPTFYLEYMAINNEADIKRVTLYHIDGERAIFNINNLQPETTYKAYMVADGGSMGIMADSEIMFTTEEHISVASISCDVEVEAKGLMADILLSNVDYLVDNNRVDIASVKVEYSRSLSNNLNWVAVDIDGSKFLDREERITIPAKGNDYLIENRDYVLRVTITPTDKEYEAMTTEMIWFDTAYAEITANIATPTLTYDGQGIHASVEDVEVFYDGIAAENYGEGHLIDYYFRYREAEGEWIMVEAEHNNGDIRITIPATTLKEDTTYEVVAAIATGAQKKMRTSEASFITTPKSEQPEPPTPPVTGDSDTSAIAGEWHLTKWRGTEPSFDIYLAISEDGVVTLWQRLESRDWQLYYSTVIYDNDTLWGEYSDGVAWGASYYVTTDGSSMTWTDTTDATDISVYERTEIPEDITIPTTATRAMSEERFL